MPNVGAEDLTAFAIAIVRGGGHAAGARAHGGRAPGRSRSRRHDSHGVVLLPTYVDRIDRGHIVPTAQPEMVNESPATLAVNGRRDAARSSRSGRWSASSQGQSRRGWRRERFASRATSGGSPTIRSWPPGPG